MAITYRRDREAAEEVVAAATECGVEAVAVAASMEVPEDLERLVAESRDALGRIDLVVANAGLASRGLPVAETQPEEVERLLAVHALAPFRLARLLIGDLRAAERGDFVVVSSSEVSRANANGAPYNMAKSALEAFALTLAKEEAANGVRVNIVAPGLIATDMGDRLVRAKLDVDSVSALDAAMPFGTVPRPEHVGLLVALLASRDASMVTGQRVVIDGGADVSPTGPDRD